MSLRREFVPVAWGHETVAARDVAARDVVATPRVGVRGAVRDALLVAVRDTAPPVVRDDVADGTLTVPDVVAVRGKTFDVVRPDVDDVVAVVPERVPMSRITVPVRADVVRDDDVDAGTDVVAPGVREMPDVVLPRLATVPDVPRFVVTVAAALRRVAARAASESSALATWGPINPRHMIKSNFIPFIPLVLSLANF